MVQQSDFMELVLIYTHKKPVTRHVLLCGQKWGRGVSEGREIVLLTYRTFAIRTQMEDLKYHSLSEFYKGP
jgi:hypothetical protein